MLKCWGDEFNRRPTFTEIVSQYDDGLLSVTSKAEQRESHVLSGKEEELHVEHRERMEASLSDSSITDISVISKRGASSPLTGTIFDVIFVNHEERTTELDTDTNRIGTPDQEDYMEMNSVSCWPGTSVLVNPATLHDYDDVAQDHCEAKVQHGHVTIDADHVITLDTQSMNGSLKASGSDYILMQAPLSLSS